MTSRRQADATPAISAVELRHKLNHEISIIGSQESPLLVRRHAVTQLLETLSTFVEQWENRNRRMKSFQQKNNHNNTEFPSGIVREALSSLVFHVGQGDGQFRDYLLQQLEQSKTLPPRQLFLDFLPLAMPMISRDSSTTTTTAATNNNNNSELESTTKQVIESLRTVLGRDPSTLIPIIGCLSSMPLTKMGRQESFQVALKSLEFVSEGDLPILVRALLKHAETEEDAVLALESLRTELMFIETSESESKESFAVEAGGDAMTMVAHVVLNALLDDMDNGTGNTNDGKGNRIGKAYVTVLERIILPNDDIDNDENNTQDDHASNSATKDDNNRPQFVILDIMVALSIFQHPEFVDDVESLLDSLLQENAFPFPVLANLLLICDKKRRGRPTSILYPRLVQSLVAFSVFLLLTPARVSGSSDSSNHENLKEVMKQSQHFIMELHHLVDREVQAEIVHLLLQLSDKVSSSNWAAKKSIHNGSRRRRPVDLLSMAFSSTMLGGDYYNAENEHYEWFQVLIADTVNATLQELAKTAKQSYSNFKHVLVGRLTSNVSAQTAPQWEQYCMRQLCGMLSALCEPAVGSSSNAVTSGGNSGIQATEIMILLQKLLFTSSYTAFASSSALGGRSGGADNRRIVRGLLLATELIKSPCLGHGDWDCVRQWVLKILLPTTRRMVEPEIGTPGLAFLEALMIDRGKASSGNMEDAEKTNQISLDLTKASFEHMKMVLANTGLIQILAVYQQQMQRQQGSKGDRDSSALAYTATTPDLFMTQSAKKRKNRQMVFCLAFFLRNSDIYLPSRWGYSVEWVFSLVETYLRVGRTVSLSSVAHASTGKGKRKKSSQSNKWVPHGWLQAAIEFPSLVLNRDFEPDNDKQRHALEWSSGLFSNEINLFTSSSMDTTDDAASGMTDLLLKTDNVSQLRPIIETMLRLGLSSLLGMSLSFAVVKNAYAHFQSYATDGSGKDDQIEALRLIQFQMVKIYDMRRKSESVERLIGSALICVQKFARRFRQDSSCQSRDSSGSRVERRSHGQEETTSLCSRTSGALGKQRRLDDDFDMTKRFREDLTSSLGELKRLRQKLFTSQEYIAFDVVYACLTDSEQTNLMKEGIETLVSSPSSESDATASKLHHLAIMRNCLLNHMVSLILGHSSMGGGLHQNKLSHGLSHFTNCVDFGLYLCSALPKLQKSSSNLMHGNMEEEEEEEEEDSLESINTTIKSLSSLTTTYLKYLCVVFAYANGREPNGTGNAGGMPKAGHSVKPTERPNMLNSSTDYVEACSEVLVSKAILNEKEKQRSSSAALTFAGFLIQLHSCNDSSIAYQLLEILSTLALSSNEIPSQEMLTASWKAMHTVYASTEEGRAQGKLPYSVMLYIRREGYVHQQTSVKKCLHDTVLKPSMGRYDAIRLSLLRHFGVLSLSISATEIGVNHLLKVFEELVSLLDSIDRPLLGTESDSNEEKKEDGRERGAAKRPPKGKTSQSGLETRESGSGGLPDLHPASFPVAFETLLHVAVAGMAVLSFPTPGKSVPGHDNVVNGTKKSGPYQRFQNLLILFGGLLELYEKKAHLFPQRSLPTIFTATKHMLAMTVRRLNGLVEWRNAQPLLSASERTQGSYDQGDTCYLEDFIKACWTHVIARPLAFCEDMKLKGEAKLPAHKQQPVDDNDDGDHSGKDTMVAIARSRNRLCSKANALRHAIEKAATVFTSIASSHNFTTSDFVHDIAENVIGSPSLKRKSKDNEADVGFHQLDGTSRSKELANVLTRSHRPAKKLRRLSIEDDSDISDGEPPSSRKTGNGKTNRLTIIDSHDEEYWNDDDNDSEAEDSLHTKENQNPSSDGSFCANGNWGEEESQASSSSESLGLELETPIFS